MTIVNTIKRKNFRITTHAEFYLSIYELYDTEQVTFLLNVSFHREENNHPNFSRKY
jgi:hypothetical protein